MAEEQPSHGRPARPLHGYLDIGAAEARHTRRAVVRAWVILAILIVVYWAVVLTVYFVEPGLR
jgi:t-SNARE complex subunit (syntaxin)